MQPFFVNTKFFIPALRIPLIERSYLLGKLTKGYKQSHRLFSISAPAGYGKTTLVQTWVESLPDSIAWYTLESCDDEPYQFLFCLIHAVQHALSKISKSQLSKIEIEEKESHQQALSILINQIIESEQPILIVLDNLHHLKSPRTIDLVIFLTEHLPKHAAVIITSRSKPPLTLPKFRARNEITEITKKDLRLTILETSEFLKLNWGLSLSAELLEQLYRKTEGWITGLQLAAIQLNELDQHEVFMRNLEGGNKLIFEYLDEEVLEKQPQKIKDFLYPISLFKQFNASLASTILEISAGEAQQILQELEQINLFIDPLDSQYEWFRLHPSFSALLKSKFRTKNPDQIKILYRKASRWFEAEGLVEEAIDCSLKGEDDIQTIGLIERNAEKLLLTGKYDQFLHFLDALPLQAIKDDTKILLYKAAALLFSECSKEDILKTLSACEQSFGAEKISGEITVIRALIQSYLGSPEKGIALSKRAINLIDPENLLFKNLVERNLGVAFMLKNDLREASKWFENLLLSGYKLEDWGSVLTAYNYLTYIRKIQGRLKDAGIIYTKALETIAEKGLELMPHSIKILSGYGHLMIQWHQIDEAKHYLRKAIKLAKQTDILYAHTAYHHLTEAFLHENDTQSALAAIHELRYLSQGKANLYEGIHSQHTRSVEAKVHLEAGRIEQAFHWLETSGLNHISVEDLKTQFGFEMGFILPVAARILIAKGNFARAIELVEWIIPKFLHQGAIAYLIRGLNALAIANFEAGNKRKAIQTLDRAIQFAEPENNVGEFIFYGKQILTLLYEALASGISQNFTSKVLACYERFEQNEIKSTNASGRIDPLSQRELDVLELIAKGMTNQEIANRLYLSSNTIKSHSIKIYRKLNVNNRNQAVSKARLLGILPGRIPSVYSAYPNY